MLRAEEIRKGHEQTEFSVLVLGDGRLRRKAPSARPGYSSSTAAAKHNEIILSDTQLLVTFGSAVAFILLFTCLLVKLWLSGR